MAVIGSRVSAQPAFQTRSFVLTRAECIFEWQIKDIGQGLYIVKSEKWAKMCVWMIICTFLGYTADKTLILFSVLGKAFHRLLIMGNVIS